MNPEVWLEVPDSPVQIRRPVNLQRGRLNQNERSRNLRLSLNHRVEQPIDLCSPTTPKDDQRKRKSPLLVISIPESSNPESRCSKKGKNVVQEVEDVSFRRPTFRDNKGKGKLDVCANEGFQDIIPDQTGLSSPPRRVGQRLLVRSSSIAPSNTARRNVAFNRGGTGRGLNSPTAGGEHKLGPAVRDNKGKGKYDGDASNHAICEISPDQSGSSVPPRPVKQRWLVRNGVIAPRNIAERTAASNNGSTSEGANAPKRSELESDQKVALPQTSAVMRRESGGQGLQPVGGETDDAILREIVADDPCRGVPRSRRELGASATSNTSNSRSAQNYRPGRLNQTSTGSARPNPAVSTTSIHVTTRPISGASTSTFSTREIGANPQIGRIGSSSSLHRGASSSMTRNLRTQAINQTVAAGARGRIIRAQGVVVRPVIDVDEMDSLDSGAAARAQQLAHDEMIARQLQEELFNETPGDWSMEEMDARIAMSLQQQENAMRAPIRRTASRAMRSAEFVAASSVVRNNAAQQMYQHFNLHDYESLLELDEDNHQHTGASISQVNSLPESIVKNCNLDESCAVCLETPSIGEKIRHLPCLHKFHKDCIDQWLQRKKECPICKSSIF